jgi:hypothetical protein
LNAVYLKPPLNEYAQLERVRGSAVRGQKSKRLKLDIATIDEIKLLPDVCSVDPWLIDLWLNRGKRLFYFGIVYFT